MRSCDVAPFMHTHISKMPSEENDCRPWLGMYSLNLSELALDAQKAVESGEDTEAADSSSEDEEVLNRVPRFDFWRLPTEVINKILSSLHAEQLSVLAQVCKDWRIYVYEPRHWRVLALKAWPSESPRALERRLYQFKTWRRMVIFRPKVRTNGIYIVRHQFSKCSTRVIASEAIAPVFLVTYHRFLRFYADGTVVSLTTPEPLDKAYRRLKKSWKPALHERDKAHPNTGRYEFHEETGTVSITLPMTQAKYPDMREGTMFYRFSVDSTHPGAFNLLHLCEHYAITDHDTGHIVRYRADAFGVKPFRFVSIWGFRTEVYKQFPRDDPHLARWSKYAMAVSLPS